MNDKQKLIFLESKIELLEELIFDTFKVLQNHSSNDNLMFAIGDCIEAYQEQLCKIKSKQEN